MIVLGVSDHIVSGASLVVDGRVVAAINEERLARMKMVMGFPWKSIEAVLQLAGVSASEVDVVAVASVCALDSLSVSFFTREILSCF